MSPKDKLIELFGPPIGIGRNRTVFRDGDYVYKFPHNPEGEGDNSTECLLYQKDKDIYAACELVYVAGILLLKMEYVRHCGWQDNQPGWTNFIDCGQVGYTKAGKLVAYDFGDN